MSKSALCHSSHRLGFSGGAVCSAVKQEHEAAADLMEFPLFTAEIQSHLQAFFQGVVKRRRGGWVAIGPQRSNADRCGVPDKPFGFPDGGLVEGLFQELADRHDRWALGPASRSAALIAIS